MSFEIVIQSEAILDMQEAFEWYEKQELGLGFEFIEEIESGYLKISKHPLHYTSVNERFRRLRINRFPYLIVYEIEGNKIYINAVRHISRKPKF
jgi:toxin ParE1/3/4